MKKNKSKRIANLYSEETNFDRDGSYAAPKAADLSSVSVPISIRIPGKQLALVKQFARRKGLPYQTLIKKWLEERLRDEAQAFLKARKDSGTVDSYTRATIFEFPSSKPATKVRARARAHS